MTVGEMDAEELKKLVLHLKQKPQPSRLVAAARSLEEALKSRSGEHNAQRARDSSAR